MNKTLKIIGGVVLAVVVLSAIVVFSFSKILKEGNGNSMLLETTQEISNQGMGLSSPMPTGFSRKSLESVDVSSAPVASFDDANESQDLAVGEKKIIKNGNLTLKVDSVDEAAEKISEIAKNNGGEIFSSNFYQRSNNVKSGTMVAKVPVSDFEKTFTEIKKVASLVMNESTSGQDVTEQYIDLQAQLRNRQAEEQSYIKILGQAQKIQDVLDVTAQLSNVRGKIEQLQGRMKYLESQTDMSTISINLSEDQNITIVDSWRPWQVVKDSFNALIKSLQSFVDFLIKFFIVALPFLAIWGAIILLLYKIGKKVYFKIKNRNQAN